MTWLLFAGVAAVIVVAGVQLARYGDVVGKKSGLGRSWILGMDDEFCKPGPLLIAVEPSHLIL